MASKDNQGKTLFTRSFSSLSGGGCTEGTLSYLSRASLCKPQCYYTHPFQCAKMQTVYKANDPLPLADD